MKKNKAPQKIKLPLRFYFFFSFYSLLFLFYPGDSQYFHIFAFNRELFSNQQSKTKVEVKPVPVVRFNFPPLVSAEGVYIVDLDSFTPVFTKNPKAKFLPASTEKVITALVAYDIYNPDQVITVKNVFSEGQLMGLIPGERITVENLLFGLLIHSGNDAAYALAQNYGMQKFVGLMNEKAKQLQMKNTRFVDPAGFDEFGQYTTPYDLALAARALLKNSYLRRTVSIKEIVISDVDFKYFHTLENVNKLLGEVQGIGGLKTGYTENAGENLISLYKRSDGRQFVIVILKSLDRFEDTKNVIAWLDTNIDYLKPPL